MAPSLACLLRVNLGEVLSARGDLAAAEAMFGEALLGARTQLGTEDRATMNAMYELGTVQIRRKKFAHAEPMLRQLLTARIRTSSDEWVTAVAQVRLGEALMGLRQSAEAERLMLEGYRGIKAAKAPFKWEDDALRCLSQFYALAGPPDKAAEWENAHGAFLANQPKARPAGGDPH